MIISPEAYEEQYLKGKSPDELMTAIRGLKQKMGHLKNTMENPEYGRIPSDKPGEDVILWCTRLYLKKAREALLEAGGTYTPSQSEMRAEDFDNNIPFIQRVTFSIGDFFCDRMTYIVTMTDKHLYLDAKSLIPSEISPPEALPDYPCTKEEFLDGLSELHLGEWRNHYNPERFGYAVLDGTQWKLVIEFSNGHKSFKVHGSNAFPYNFGEFLDLLGISVIFD